MTMEGNDSEGTDIIEFGLAEKSRLVLQNHMKALTNLENSIKSMVKPGTTSGGIFSGKFLQVAQAQLLYQKDIAAGIRQMNLSFSKGIQVRRQYDELA